MATRKWIAGPLLIIAGAATLSCVSKIESDIGKAEGSLTCDEFTASGTIDASLDVRVRAFLEATQEFRNLSADVRTTVRNACISVASDLGAEDTWSAFGDDDKAVDNDGGTGACNQASAKIKAIMEAHADASFALVVTRGHCHQDFTEIQKCDTKCTTDQVCTPGPVETRCEPGQVSFVCQGKCKASAQCEGTVDVAANCMGSCESTCEGECKGTCIHSDGKKTENDANCHGKCSASCNGKCRGACKIEASAGIDCGASVRCKGECEGTVTEPTCETKCSPPSCKEDTTCYDSCTTEVQAKTVCEPTRVELFADVSVSADVQKLQATINANLAVLVDAAQVKGPLILDAANKLSATGNAVLQARASLDLKSQACAAVGAEHAATSASHLATTARGGATVTDTCTGHAQ
jgi:hypothetical protein